MSTPEAEFSGILNAAGTVLTISVTAAVAAGKFIAVSAADSAATALTSTATDSRGNTYVRDRSQPNDPTTISGSAHQLRTKVTTPLQVNDVITVTFSATATRAAGVASVYPDNVTMPHTAGSVGNGAGSGTATSAAPNSGNFTPAAIGDLEIATVNLVSSARIFTPAAGWTAGTKIVSTSGSGDRGVQQFWRNAASVAAQAASGTLNSAALWSVVAESYAVTASGRSGRPWIWNGSAWAAKPLMVWNGSAWVEKPVSGWNGSAWILSK